MEGCSRIKTGYRRLVQGEDEVQRILKDYVDTQEQVAVHICGFDGIQRGNYFRGEPIGRAEVSGEAQEWKG